MGEFTTEDNRRVKASANLYDLSIDLNTHGFYSNYLFFIINYS